jgi:hypothetical protein
MLIGSLLSETSTNRSYPKEAEKKVKWTQKMQNC